MTTGTPDSYRTGRRQDDGRHPASRRRGLRALLPLAIAAWVVLEIWLLALLGQAAGGWTVFLVLVAGLLLGGAVIRRAGRRAWQRLAASVQPGATPPEQPAARGGNGLTMLGGLLLMVPGLLSDALGLLCVFPPTAALLRRAGTHWLSSAKGPMGIAFREARHAEQHHRARRPDGKVVQGEVLRDEDDDEPHDDEPRDSRP